MFRGLLLLLALPLSILRGQDKLYFLNGESKSGKVLEVGSEQVVFVKDLDTFRVYRFNLMFIEYKMGRTEVLNRPVWDATYRGRASSAPVRNQDQTLLRNPNQVYVNTLSLVNADFSLYYEYILNNKSVGLGCFGTYNFNTYAGFPNLFIAVLNNGKKLYDAGLFLTRYSRSNSDHRLFYGIMIKYTEFRYSAALLDTINKTNTPNVQVNYIDSKGHQISPLFHMGVHTDISDLLFIKTSFSLGFFHLAKTYSQQFSYAVSEPGEPVESVQFLVKGSIGLCLGFKF